MLFEFSMSALTPFYVYTYLMVTHRNCYPTQSIGARRKTAFNILAAYSALSAKVITTPNIARPIRYNNRHHSAGIRHG